MKSDIDKYVSGEKNAVQDEFIISREKCGNSDFVHIHHSKMPEPLYEFWASRKKKRGGKPRHTGGKKPYVMLMIEGLTAQLANGLPAGNIGYLICLAPYIDWGTGRLIYGRQKRQMKISDIETVFQKSRRMTLYILSGLKKYGLLTHDREGYFISRDFLRRGSKSAN